jgi:hypothetical protein
MIIKNRLQYCPPAIMLAASNTLQKPQPNIFRVTELIDSPLIKRLLIEHWDRTTVDVDQLIEALDGTAWHEFLMQHAPKDTYAEIPFQFEVNGVTIKGTPDFYQPNEKILADYKKIKSYKYVKKDFLKFEQQLNLYAYFLEAKGMPVERIQVFAHIKDWSRYSAFQSKDYPQSRNVNINIPRWNKDDTEEYIRERIRVHLGSTTECTPEERWQKEPTFAVRKHGAKRAMKVEETLWEAQAWAAGKNLDPNSYTIETRPGECVRCAENWCLVANHCPYWQAQLEQQRSSNGSNSQISVA